MAAGAFLHGLESTGVCGCLKHFPGLSGTKIDSHVGLPEIKDMAQINKNLIPFRALSSQDRLIMVGHVKMPGTGGLPASLHRGSVSGNPWGIAGGWISDDLEMGGCAQWSWKEKVKLCLEAGHQALLVCQTDSGVAACIEALSSLHENQWISSRERFLTYRRRLLPPDPIPFNSSVWNAWLEEVQIAAKNF